MSKELKKYSIILITMFIFLISLSPVHASSSDYVSYSRFKNATDHFIIDNTGKEYGNSDITHFSYSDYMRLKKKGFILCYSEDFVTPNKSSTILKAFSQKIKVYNFSGSTNCKDSPSHHSFCNWKVSLTCRFSYNDNTGKVSNAPAPILHLEQAIVTTIYTAKITDAFLDSITARVNKVNYSSVDYYCSFRIQFIYHNETCNLGTFSFYRTLAIA